MAQMTMTKQEYYLTLLMRCGKNHLKCQNVLIRIYRGYFGETRNENMQGESLASKIREILKKLSARTGAKEGKNIKVGAVDEVHEMQDNSLVMPIRQALSTQDEPIYIEITSEGFTDGGYLDKETDEARKVLLGESEDDRWLIFMYEQDSEEEIWQNENSWYKSNPGLGVIKKWSFLRQW